MSVGISEVNTAVARWAHGAKLDASSDELAEFSDYIWQTVKNDDVFDVNLNSEWRQFKNQGHWYTR